MALSRLTSLMRINSACSSVHFARFSDNNRASQNRIADLLTRKPVGSQALIKGWVRRVRKLKNILFIDVLDGSCADKLQVVLGKSLKPENLSFGASVEAGGNITLNDQGQLELAADEVKILGPCFVNDGYPFTGKMDHPPEYIRKHLHFRSRTTMFSSTMRVRDAVTRAIHDYFHSQGYININTPILTSNDCEGAGEVFCVKPNDEKLLKSMIKPGISPEGAYFDGNAFLTVSGQLHLEAIARGLGNVYTLGPTFRAENSRSRLHLSEFYMLEAEAAFMDNLTDLVNLVERFIKQITSDVLNKCEQDVNFLQNTNSRIHIKNVIEKSFVVLSFKEASSILEKHFEGTSILKEGLNKEHELFLVDHVGNIPVFVVEWPKSLKPFYMKQNTETSQVAALDLLVPTVGELCGGSVREDNYAVLEKELSSAGLSKSFNWYLDIRKFGNIPTAGFGMGFERYLQVLLGVENIKDTIPFPRWPHNCML